MTDQSLTDDRQAFKGFRAHSVDVFDAYVDNKHAGLAVNTQDGLAKLVEIFDTANDSAANTHVLIGNKGDYSAYAMGTATAAKMYLRRFAIETQQNVQNKWGKGSGVHTEMHMLFKITNGDASKIDGCLKGKKIVVDKEICAKCYPFIVRANPDEVRDGAGAKTAQQRATWDAWANPFNIK